MELLPLIGIILIHWFSDFFLQSHNMAINKSTSNAWLGYHVAVYSLPFAIFFGLQYAVINFILHFITDWFSSRISKHYWNDGDTHTFFLVIGADQAIHMLSLIGTYVWLFN